jgi:hypothetical protein
MSITKNSSTFTLYSIFQNRSKINLKKSNKLWIYICLHWRIPIFRDYIDSLELVDIEISYNSPEELKLIDYNDSCNYIIPFDITDAHNAGFLPKNTIFINTEPVDENNKCIHIETALSFGYKIIDYSPINAKVYSLLYIPYQIREEENSRLRKLLLNTEKERDAVTCSYMVPRRQEIYLQALRKGLNMINVTGYDNKRDEEIAEGKILLNVHQREYSVFEHIRCDRWIYAGMTVVSENSRKTRCCTLCNFRTL